MKPYNLTLTFLLILSIFSCSALDKVSQMIPQPEFQFLGLRIAKISFTDLTLRMDTSVKNPYPVSIPTSQLGMDLFLEGSKLSRIDTDLGAIQSKSTKNLPLNIQLKYSDLIRFYRNFPKKEVLDLQLKGDLKLPIPAQYQLAGKKEISFPVEHTRPIPSFHPSLDVSDFKVELPDLKQVATETVTGVFGSILGNSQPKDPAAVSTSFALKFGNSGASQMLLNQLNFDMDLEGQKFFSGAPEEIQQSGTTNLAKVNTKIPVTSATTAIIKTLQSKRGNFQLRGVSAIQFPGIAETNIPFEYEKIGNLQWK